MRCAPKTASVCSQLLQQADRLRRAFWLARAYAGCVLPAHAEKLSMPPQERLRLDKQACPFPEATHPDQEHQQKPSCLLEGRSFDHSAQHATLLSYERVFRQQLSLASRGICERAKQKRGQRWLHPQHKSVLKHMLKRRDTWFAERKETPHA